MKGGMWTGDSVDAAVSLSGGTFNRSAAKSTFAAPTMIIVRGCDQEAAGGFPRRGGRCGCGWTVTTSMTSAARESMTRSVMRDVRLVGCRRTCGQRVGEVGIEQQDGGLPSCDEEAALAEPPDARARPARAR